MLDRTTMALHSLYTHEIYCQEVWDLGRAITKFNDFVRMEYWEICDPKQMRRLYRFIKQYINKFSTFVSEEDEIEEEDLFIFISQERFDKLNRFLCEFMVQFPNRECIMEYIENIVYHLRQLNNWLESSSGQNANWFRVHNQYEKDVIMSWWNSCEILNFIPDRDEVEMDQNRNENMPPQPVSN